MVQNCSMWFNVVQFVLEPHFLKIGAKLQKISETYKFFTHLLFLFYKKEHFGTIFAQNRQESRPNVRYPICR